MALQNGMILGRELGLRLVEFWGLSRPQERPSLLISESSEIRLVIWDDPQQSESAIRQFHREFPFSSAFFLSHHLEAPPSWDSSLRWGIVRGGLRGYGRCEPEAGRILVDDFELDSSTNSFLSEKLKSSGGLSCFCSERQNYRGNQTQWLRQELGTPLIWPELYPVLMAARDYKFSLGAGVGFGNLNSLVP